MGDSLRIGLAGLGTVGVGVIRLLETNRDLLTARAGRPLQVTAVSARSKDKDRGINISGYAWEDDPVALATRDDVDVFVELVGGSDGPAKAAVEAALKAGKDVVITRIDDVSHHLTDLLHSVRQNGYDVSDVEVHAPSLQHVFLHLTGNELRDG